MNLDQIKTECYILALFIRDDGERFLLGSGAYEFTKSQKQFIANNYANDIVEVQGNDGILLAGQVRRPNTQSFDGYIGDATVIKSKVETYRKAFLAFFRKNYYYKVVYIFSDGSAIQRRQGFIVDAPEVKELYQFYPEYHVALNFEDTNYYSYLEDGDGNEIYGKNATIPLSTSPSDGGLMWDSYGAIVQAINWSGIETVSGTELNINNPLNYRVPFSDVKLYGNTIQTGVPSINSPATIQTVTGTQTVTVTDSNSNTESYTISLGANNLNSIGNIKDSIIKDNGQWKLTKLTDVFIVNNNLTLVSSTSTSLVAATPVTAVKRNLSSSSISSYVTSTHLPAGGNSQNKISGSDSSGRILITVSKQIASTIQQLNTKLAGAKIYFALESSSINILTGQLETQLDALLGGELFKGDNTITTTVTANTQKPVLELSYYTEAPDGYGFVWEAGTSGGVTTINIDSIDNVYPIWEVVGPAVNPMLSNITTNTTLTYSGAVGQGQKLVVNMLNKTATLNGTSVVIDISGDWIYFKGGTNRITYTTDNNDADASNIYWQEIVG